MILIQFPMNEQAQFCHRYEYAKTFFTILTVTFVLCTGFIMHTEADPENQSPDREKASEEIDSEKRTNLFSVGGSIRLRGEARDDFRFGRSVPSNEDTFLLSRLRLNLDYQPTDNVRFFVQGQDARVFDGESINEDARPNLNWDELDIHQGYVDLQFRPNDVPVRVRLGRQEIILGDKRVFSNLGWSNTAVSGDSIRVTAGEEDHRTLDVFATNGVPPNPSGFNDWETSGNRLFDSQYYGMYFTDQDILEEGQLEGYWLFRHHDSPDDRVHTLGLRYDKQWGPWDSNGEFAVQEGEFGGNTHRGFAAHIEGGYQFSSLNDLRAAALYDYASGDGDSTDSTHSTFDNIAYIPLNHAYYGYMDFFSWQNLHHVAATFEYPFSESLGTRLAWHEFWLDEEDTDAWYDAGRSVVRSAGGTDVNSHVGSELDFTVNYSTKIAGKDTKFLLGYSHFFTGDYVSDTGPDSDADYLYLQTQISF